MRIILSILLSLSLVAASSTPNPPKKTPHVKRYTSLPKNLSQTLQQTRELKSGYLSHFPHLLSWDTANFNQELNAHLAKIDASFKKSRFWSWWFYSDKRFKKHLKKHSLDKPVLNNSSCQVQPKEGALEYTCHLTHKGPIPLEVESSEGFRADLFPVGTATLKYTIRAEWKDKVQKMNIGPAQFRLESLHTEALSQELAGSYANYRLLDLLVADEKSEKKQLVYHGSYSFKTMNNNITLVPEKEDLQLCLYLAEMPDFQDTQSLKEMSGSLPVGSDGMVKFEDGKWTHAFDLPESFQKRVRSEVLLNALQGRMEYFDSLLQADTLSTPGMTMAKTLNFDSVVFPSISPEIHEMLKNTGASLYHSQMQMIKGTKEPIPAHIFKRFRYAWLLAKSYALLIPEFAESSYFEDRVKTIHYLIQSLYASQKAAWAYSEEYLSRMDSILNLHSLSKSEKLQLIPVLQKGIEKVLIHSQHGVWGFYPNDMHPSLFTAPSLRQGEDYSTVKAHCEAISRSLTTSIDSINTKNSSGGLYYALFIRDIYQLMANAENVNALNRYNSAIQANYKIYGLKVRDEKMGLLAQGIDELVKQANSQTPQQNRILFTQAYQNFVNDDNYGSFSIDQSKFWSIPLSTYEYYKNLTRAAQGEILSTLMSSMLLTEKHIELKNDEDVKAFFKKYKRVMSDMIETKFHNHSSPDYYVKTLEYMADIYFKKDPSDRDLKSFQHEYKSVVRDTLDSGATMRDKLLDARTQFLERFSRNWESQMDEKDGFTEYRGHWMLQHLQGHFTLDYNQNANRTLKVDARQHRGYYAMPFKIRFPKIASAPVNEIYKRVKPKYAHLKHVADIRILLETEYDRTHMAYFSQPDTLISADGSAKEKMLPLKNKVLLYADTSVQYGKTIFKQIQALRYFSSGRNTYEILHKEYHPNSNTFELTLDREMELHSYDQAIQWCNNQQDVIFQNLDMTVLPQDEITFFFTDLKDSLSPQKLSVELSGHARFMAYSRVFKEPRSFGMVHIATDSTGKLVQQPTFGGWELPIPEAVALLQDWFFKKQKPELAKRLEPIKKQPHLQGMIKALNYELENEFGKIELPRGQVWPTTYVYAVETYRGLVIRIAGIKESEKEWKRVVIGYGEREPDLIYGDTKFKKVEKYGKTLWVGPNFESP